eukprot:9473147-Pyramimonas_sp.AAC.1
MAADLGAQPTPRPRSRPAITAPVIWPCAARAITANNGAIMTSHSTRITPHACPSGTGARSTGRSDRALKV